jgi:predicted AAA+ superfamily ATPase
MDYRPRFIDLALADMLDAVSAIALEGAKGVGKTATATLRAASVFSADRQASAEIVSGNPEVVLQAEKPVFIDEWQLVPSVWNEIRHAVDDGAEPGSFILAGSASPKPGVNLHSGAGRIVRLMMRPMSLPERGFDSPTVSLQQLLSDPDAPITGSTTKTVSDYTQEILASGFPGIRSANEKGRGYLLDSYLDRIIDHDVVEAGAAVRRPQALMGWLRAYAAATATTTSYASLLEAATPGDENGRPAKQTTTAYRELLGRMFVLDPIDAWLPGFSHLKRLGQAPKHHLVDPALAAKLVGSTADTLLRGEGPSSHRDGTFLGALFESLAAQTIRVLAQAANMKVFHMRTQGGDHEVDLIVQRPDGKVVAIEVKLSSMVRPADVAQLKYLDENAPGTVINKVLLNTGEHAYRRKDGIAVVPLALIGL